jgi:glycerate 2-kinase
MPLRDDAISIWNAGIAAVDSAKCVAQQIRCEHQQLWIADTQIPLSTASRIEVIGAGKAGAGMASGVEAALMSTDIADCLSGWVNVPADCVRPLRRIHLHAARPAGLNEPTPEAVRGTQEILRRVQSLRDSDICIVLLSGGASALLCSPAPGISLDNKLSVTRALAGSGAPIQELNLVRTQLSQVKGGRLAAACRAGTLVALIISDVIGDPLDVIGSGPTISSVSRADDALQVLRDRRLLDQIPASVVEYLERAAEADHAFNPLLEFSQPPSVINHIVASNAIAIDAAAVKARELGYEVRSLGSENAGEAADEGRQLIGRLQATRTDHHRVCILSGGEPTVNLSVRSNTIDTAAPHNSAARGGRNQELVLAAVAAYQNAADWKNIVLLSGGTDGEDGPTNAAGAIADEALVKRIIASGIDPDSYLARHDSYTIFDAVGGLFKTGPTHTNVMDLRVGLSIT